MTKRSELHLHKDNVSYEFMVSSVKYPGHIIDANLRPGPDKLKAV